MHSDHGRVGVVQGRWIVQEMNDGGVHNEERVAVTAGAERQARGKIQSLAHPTSSAAWVATASGCPSESDKVVVIFILLEKFETARAGGVRAGVERRVRCLAGVYRLPLQVTFLTIVPASLLL
jgi:hypothetical protein